MRHHVRMDEQNGSAGAAAILAVVVALGCLGLADQHREVAHNDNDDLSVTKQLRATDLSGLSDAVTALGGPPDKPPDLPGVCQAVVLRLDWTGPERDGRYHVVVLDNRVSPPRPLLAYVGWTGRDASGAFQPADVGDWTEAQDALAERYVWLAEVDSAPEPTGEEAAGALPTTQVVSAPATADGTITAVFLVTDDQTPFTDVEREALVVLFHVDGAGEVRWARSV